MAIVGTLTVLMGMNNAPLLAGVASSSAAMKGMGATGVSTGAIVSKALLGIGAVGAIGLVTVVKAAADFEDAMTGVKKTVDEADLTAAGMTFEGLGMQFRQMATELPVAATELAAIGETAGALGIKAADIESFTRTVAMLGVTTDLTTGVAAESLGKIGTLLGLTGGEYAAFADILVNLGNKGASTESEILEVTKRFASAGMQAGLTTPEILAFSSAIASAGVEPEAAGSSLSRLFGNLVLGAANATAAGKAFAKTTGMAFGDFSKLVKTDTVGAMLLVLSSLKDLDKFEQAQALKAMGITNVRDVNAIRALAATYTTNLIPAIEYANSSQGAATVETEKRLQSLNAQLTLLGNNFTELAIKLGTPLLPALTTFVQDLSGAVSGLEGTIGRVVAMYNSLPAVLREPIKPPPGLVPSPVAEGVKPGLTDVVGQALGIIPQGAFSGQPKPWGSFGTPGFGAGEVGSPFYGPPMPITPQLDRGRDYGSLFHREVSGAAFGSLQPSTRQPIHLHHTTINQLDSREIARSVETTLYNDWGVFSSGGSSDDRPRQ